MASIGDFINFEAYMVKRIERYHRLFHSNSKLKQMLGRYIFNRSKRICSCNIYPAAIWGKNIYLVHPDDVWIGETAVLGNNIMIYPGVKLAANFTKKPGENGRRHARISDDCILCINSTVVDNIYYELVRFTCVYCAAVCCINNAYGVNLHIGCGCRLCNYDILNSVTVVLVIGFFNCPIGVCGNRKS